MCDPEVFLLNESSDDPLYCVYLQTKDGCLRNGDFLWRKSSDKGPPWTLCVSAMWHLDLFEVKM